MKEVVIYLRYLNYPPVTAKKKSLRGGSFFYTLWPIATLAVTNHKVAGRAGLTEIDTCFQATASAY